MTRVIIGEPATRQCEPRRPTGSLWPGRDKYGDGRSRAQRLGETLRAAPGEFWAGPVPADARA